MVESRTAADTVSHLVIDGKRREDHKNILNHIEDFSGTFIRKTSNTGLIFQLRV